MLSIRPPKAKAANRESCVTHAIPKEAGMAGEPAWGRVFRRPDYLYSDRCGLPGVASGIHLPKSHRTVSPTRNAGAYMDCDTKIAFL